ncbi:unnamed protein product [Staurois parvus]|uniref:Uncharacterized protein n=1 Tax=Staurois parvus TaxID=386267 RepID=A0ABN9D2W1_9NEOB|nr:unnamed protein product [Staurois parvus]
MIRCSCHLATPPGSLSSSASSPLIGHRNCSSGEAHRRQSPARRWSLERRSRAAARVHQRRSRELPERVKRRAAREGRQLTGVSKVSIIGVSGRNSAPSFVSLIPTMGHYSFPH